MNNEPLSLYIHTPFCAKKCRYCDFYSVSYDKETADAFVAAIIQEWGLLKDRHRLGDEISTIYMGGGTPSLLTQEHLGLLKTELFDKLDLTKLQEWTIEANPESFSSQKAQLWKSMGATRLSLGVQSLRQKELSFSGRLHSAQRALDVLNDPVLKEFRSVGADIIYALPGQTPESLEKTLRAILSTGSIHHLSAYELTLSRATPFGRHQTLLPVPSEELAVRMYEFIGNICREYAMEQYEISNYSLKGHRSVHNSAYWNHSPYIGLGPSAHSYLHPFRWSNGADVDEYITKISSGTLPITLTEEIGRQELSAEMIFLGLRRSEGIDETDYFARVGDQFVNKTRSMILDNYLSGGMIFQKDNRWALTDRGRLFADRIARDLI